MIVLRDRDTRYDTIFRELAYFRVGSGISCVQFRALYPTLGQKMMDESNLEARIAEEAASTLPRSAANEAVKDHNDNCESEANGTSSSESKESNLNSNEEAPLSKRQLRKLEKHRLWEESKNARRESRRKRKHQQKERRKQQLEKMKEEAQKEGVEPSTIVPFPSRKKLKSNTMKNSTCKVGVCVDMSFSNLMQEKDLYKCIKQLNRCYSTNRRLLNPVQFHITGLVGESKAAMDKQCGWQNWDIYFHEQSYMDLEEYPKDKVVYLTAESENVLTEPEDHTLYVIGGLVDHNHHKGLCHKLAAEKGVRHARLPLGEFIDMNRRKVLSILHVFEILAYVAQKRPWQEVLLEVLPPRNHARLKNHSSDEDASLSEEEETFAPHDIKTEITDEHIM